MFDISKNFGRVWHASLLSSKIACLDLGITLGSSWFGGGSRRYVFAGAINVGVLHGHVLDPTLSLLNNSDLADHVI